MIFFFPGSEIAYSGAMTGIIGEKKDRIASAWIILAGAFLGACFWPLDCVVDCVFFKEQSLAGQFLSPRPAEIWVRLFVFVLFVLFSFHASHNLGRRRKAEEELQEARLAGERLNMSLDEKDMLMREIHHRVKNNLITIHSLLILQSHSIEDERSRSYFKEAENRVRSMAMIHERLCRTKDLSNMNLAEYLNSLISVLFHTYNVKASRVKLNVNIPAVSIDVDTMIPLGLIINELVSNALKYAFANGGEGELTVAFTEGGDGEYTLVVKDDGAGIPDGFDIHNTKTLGLQIVSTLTKQIRGRIELLREGGTGFRITFRRKKSKK
jgi:two-component sensor histidine kinase